MSAEENIQGIGILHTTSALKKYCLKRYMPSEALTPFIQRYWIVHWDLSGMLPYEQHLIPHPCVNLVFEKGKSKIWGISKGRTTRLIEGKGTVFGVKFRPGGFYPFWNAPVSELTGSSINIENVFGEALVKLEDRLLSDAADAEKVKLAESFFLQHVPECNEELLLVYDIVEKIMTTREITRVEHVAGIFDIHSRKLQRLFRTYVGVSPKWMIKRYRLHEAAQQMESGQNVDGTRLALDLGYYDQAHFIKDFQTMIGFPPDKYARTLND